MIQKGASDLHITVGNRPKLRVDGDLVNAQIQPRPESEGHPSAGLLHPDGGPEEAVRDGG